jgi:hypothetical protein
LIEVQKERAIARWEEAFSKKYFDDKKIYNKVLEQLKEGKVPPIYHTLIREPEKRLFLPNTFVSNGKAESGSIKLSSEKVQVGSGRIHLTSLHYLCSATQRFFQAIGQRFLDLAEYPDNTWQQEEFSYLDVFFTKDGQVRLSVKDIYIREGYWNFDEEISKIVTVLVNTPAKMVGHDLEVTELPAEFPVDLFHGRNLITRSLSRGVVADCFENSKPGSVYAIVGSPGIGKSWNLIYALQQALLFENSCVLFCFQKKGKAWICIRKENQIYAWSNVTYGFEKFRSALFRNKNVLALLDPKEAPAGGATYTVERQRLIFAASNNAAHFKNVYKDTFDFERILNPYSTLELKIALKYMSASAHLYSDEEILPMLQLAEQVGNMPRYIMSKVGASINMKKIRDYLHGVEKMDSIMLLKFLSFKGTTSVQEKDSIEGAIFSLFAAGSIYSDFTLVDVGYDGDAVVDGKAVVQYENRIVEFVCNHIRVQVAVKYRATLLCYDGKTADGLGSHFGHIVEELLWVDIKNKEKMEVHKLSYKEEEKGGAENMNENVGNVVDGDAFDDDDNDNGDYDDFLNDDFLNVADDDDDDDVDDGEWKQKDTFHFEYAKALANRVDMNEVSEIFKGKYGKSCICRTTGICPFVDYATSDRQVFQVTVKKDRSILSQGLQDFLIAAGILREEKKEGNRKKGKLTYSEEAQLSGKNPNLLQKLRVNFYWVVPKGITNRWKKKAAVIVAGKSKKSALLNDALKKFVDQYVAILSPNLKTFENEKE